VGYKPKTFSDRSARSQNGGIARIATVVEYADNRKKKGSPATTTTWH